MKSNGTLIFFCGKMGAGKSTKSQQLALDRNAVLISEDEWLASLYPDQIASFEDYLKFSSQLSQNWYGGASRAKTPINAKQ